MLLVIMRLAQKAETNHSAAVVWRHQRVSRGYIFIALLQGSFFWVPALWMVSAPTRASDLTFPHHSHFPWLVFCLVTLRMS